MSFSLRCLPAFVVVFFSLTVSVFAQSTAPPGKVPRGGITGRVTIKEKGAPGVAVGVRKYSRASPLAAEPFTKTITDQDGNFRITNLAAGSYEVVPSAPGFVVGQTNNVNVRTKSIIVNEDETVEGINFSLVRGGVITGRVTDAEGRPAVQQGVQIYRVESESDQQAGRRPLSPSNAAATDDRGIYRVFGLPPGRYKVAAGKGEDAFAQPALPGRFVYTQVFYPDASDQSKATVLEVTEGSETKDIDIHLGRALETFSASGRVINDKNAAVPNLRFGLQRGTGEHMEFVNSMAVSNSQGDFIVEGLIPGKYGIYLFPMQGEDMRVQNISFEIVDQDVKGITIKLSKGGTVAGVVVLETEDKTALEKMAKLQLRAFVSTGGGFAGSASSPIAPDGGFRLAGLHAGTVNIMLGSMTHPMQAVGFNISRIERDGVPLTKAIEIKDGEQITNVRIVLSYGTAALRGVVKLENGTLPEGAAIYIKLSKPGESTMHIRPAQVDARGQFVIEAVAPGLYEIQAQVYGPNTGQPKITKKEVHIQDGVANEVSITIDMTPSPAQPKP